MDTGIRESISLFIDNCRTLKKPLLLKSTSLNIKLCALSYALEGIRVLPENLIGSMDYIRKNTKWYSPIRASSILTAALLSASGENLEKSFDRFIICYEALKKAGFKNPIHLTVASMALFATKPEGSEQIRANSARIIFNRVRHLHPFLTSSELYVTSVVMSGSGRTPEESLNDLEETLRHMRSRSFYSSGALQFLAGILSFDSLSPLEKAEKCSRISEFLAKMKLKIPSMFYGIIGFLALSGDHLREAVKDTLETVSLLKLAKCFSSFDKEYALLFAAAIVINGYLKCEGVVPSRFLNAYEGAAINTFIEAQIIACAVSETAITVVLSPG